jgi:hypothetical protein
VIGVAEPLLQTRTVPNLGEAGEDWLCAWCLNPVATDSDRFKIEGKSEFCFSNPMGVRFEIMTFSRAIGCGPAGMPTLENTWFPGHAWCFSHCDQCDQQLGWSYSGQHQFVALIKDRIVRGTLVRN